MKTTKTRFQVLEAGQALALPPQRPTSIVLAEGELLLQPAARWLGGSIVVVPASRVAAPAAFAVDEACTVVAVGEAKVLLEEREPALSKVARWFAPLSAAGTRTPAPARP